jgi:hypothetical protein
MQMVEVFAPSFKDEFAANIRAKIQEGLPFFIQNELVSVKPLLQMNGSECS